MVILFLYMCVFQKDFDKIDLEISIIEGPKNFQTKKIKNSKKPIKGVMYNKS